MVRPPSSSLELMPPHTQQHHQLGVSARILALLPPRKTLLRYRYIYRDLFLRWPLPSFSKSRKEPGRKASSLPWVEFPSCRQRGLWPKGRLSAHPYKPQSLNPPSAGGKECAESSTMPGGLSGLAQRRTRDQTIRKDQKMTR